MPDADETEAVIYAFGRFRLDARRRVLLCDGAPVGLPSRALGTLLCLVRHAGRVVEREELLRDVWGGRSVADANVKQAVFALRRVLRAGSGDDRLIVTAPTHGYVFTAPVHIEAAVAGPAPAPAWLGGRGRLIAAASGACALAVVALLAASPGAPGPPAGPAPPHSVAVLPFANLSGDGGQAYFSDGLSEELINTLGRIGDLRVAARTSSFAAAGAGGTVPEIGRRLHVGAVLEGSVRRGGGQVRIAASLIDAATGFTLWSASYDRPGGDVLATEAAIAASVGAALRVRLLDDGAALLAGGTGDAAAFDAYLRGAKLADAGDAAAALPAFDQALALDGGFALARARRSQALLALANGGMGGDLAAVRRGVDEAVAEARRAVAAAPSVGLAHLALGAALMSAQDFGAADREMAAAHALAPGDAAVTLDYALAQLQFGRPAAGVRAAEAAVALDPLRAATYGIQASILVAAHRDADARTALRRARILGDDPGVRAVEAAMALRAGDYATMLHRCDAGDGWAALFCRALALHGAGRQAEAAAALAALHARLGDTGSLQYAELAAQWGSTPDALRWLQAAYRVHDTGLVLIKSDPLLDPVRGTAGYRTIERSLNYPAE